MTFEHLDDQQPFIPDDQFRAAALHEGRRRRRRRLSLGAASGAAAVFVVALIVVVTVPRSTDPGRVDTPPTVPTTTTPALNPTTTTPQSTTTSIAPTTTTSPPVEVDTSESGYFFDTPSGNISCVISDSDAACDVQRYSYDPGPTPPDCPLDFGYRVDVSLDRPAGFDCSSDSLNVSDVVLGYGSGVRSGGTVCRSAESGVTCTVADGRGFFVSRESYRFF